MPEPLLEPQTNDLALLLTEVRGQELHCDEDAELASREELARVNFGLEKIIEERTAKLRELIAELDEVSYALVHNMRAPLRAMRGFAQLLENPSTEVSAAEKRDYLERIITASSRLDKLIEDSLTYNRAVLRVLPLQAVDLHQLLRGLIETYPAFQSKNADVRVEGPLPVVLGNEGLLTQCFSNLLNNAVKFVAPGLRPQVRVRAECTSEVARIWIEDNGIGIPRPAQRRLFGLFQKLNNEYEGTGLGLAIVRKAMERMNGKFGVESEPGQGSRFWVEFKRADAH